MPSDGHLPLAALLASTAAVSCGLTALAAWHILPRYIAQQQHGKDQHGQVSTPEPGVDQSSVSSFSPTNPQKRPDPYDTRPRSTYLSWDDYFMAVAFLSAERSKDPNKQVGACIVSQDNIILSIGYNGFPRGCPDSKLPWSKKASSGSILDTKYPYVVHAEANALLNKNQAHVGGARIYVTLFPCNECAKLLIQAGIKEVVYHEAKLEPTGRRPATMEQAAAADTAEDDAAAAAAAAGVSSSQRCSNGSDSCPHCSSSSSNSQSSVDLQQPDAVTINKQQQQKFSVGASSDLDASYIASQRLLTMAGVKLRQHTLRRTVQLPPGTVR